MQRLLLATAVFCLLLAAGPAAWARKWTSSDGRFSVEAELVDFADGQVTLKKPGGETVSVPLSRLSVADRQFVVAATKTPKPPAKGTPRGGKDTVSPAQGAPKDEGRQAIWPMYRGNPQRTGQSPYQGPVHMRVKWELNLAREFLASPAIASDGLIYVGVGAQFYAITPEGKALWHHNFADGRYTDISRGGIGKTSENQGFFSPSPALAPDGTVYQPCGRRGGKCFILALDPSPGSEKRVKWELQTNREVRASPLVTGGICFVGDTHARMVTAFDGNGNLRWEIPGEYALISSSPALSRDRATLYIGGYDNRLHALDAITGKEKWSVGPERGSAARFRENDNPGREFRRFTTSGHIPEAPAVGPDGTIYFGSWDGHLYAAAPDGKLRWAIDLKDRVTSAPAVSDDGRVLVSTFEGTLYAVRVVGGRPVVDWQAEADSTYSSPLISADGRVYVGGLDGRLRAYALESGKLIESLAAFEDWIYASAVPGGDGLLYLGCGDGCLRAIESGGPQTAGNIAAVAAGDNVPKQPKAVQRSSIPTRTIPLQAAGATGTRELAYDEALKLARAYMEDEDEAKRQRILQAAETFGERLDEIALALRPVPRKGAPTGYLLKDKFTVPAVRARLQRIVPAPDGPVQLPRGMEPLPAGTEHRTYVYVPKSYDPRRPLGLMIHLHGGGAGKEYTDQAAQELLKCDSWGMDLMRGGDFVVACPSALPMNYQRWSYPESEIHIQSIIEEYSTRYAIDPNRVYLTGFSMGGEGTFWHMARQSDRFAVMAPMGPCWFWAYWPRHRGTLIYVGRGAFDLASRSVNNTRYAHTRMKELDVPHVSTEYIGAHTQHFARPHYEALVELCRTVNRDPYCSHVCAISPFTPEVLPQGGSAASKRYPPSPHSFWISVLEHGPDAVPVDKTIWNTNRVYDSVVDANGRRSQRNAAAHTRSMMRAGAAEAENLGGNRFRVRVTNVKRFGLWLHPKMGVDFSRPVEIELVKMAVDPKTLVETQQSCEKVVATARPSLAAMLKYLGDRRDFGLIYHAVVEVAVAKSPVTR